MTVSKHLRFEIPRRDNFQCRYCGGAAPDVALTVDHVIPVALGGTDEASNLVSACQPCNSGKSATPPDAPLVEDVSRRALDWAAAMEYAAAERRSNRGLREDAKVQFETHWQGYRLPGYQSRYHETLPAGWQGTIDQVLDAGLDAADLIELVDVAMGSSNVREKWRYFCGCCWRRVRETQSRAAELLAVDGHPEAGH